MYVIDTDIVEMQAREIIILSVWATENAKYTIDFGIATLANEVPLMKY